MGVELLAGRLLAPYFGSSVHVWGSVITVFMLALSLGYLIGGQWSLHAPSNWKFGIMFLVGGLLIIPLSTHAHVLLEWLFDHFEDPRYGSLVASMLLFFPSTVILGMISPYAIRLLTRDTVSAGHVAGRLYFVSTFGSAAGTILTSFYFVLWWETSHIIAGFVLVLLCVGALVALLPQTERDGSP